MRGAPPLYHTIESAHAPPRTFEKRTYEKVREARAAVLHELIPLAKPTCGWLCLTKRLYAAKHALPNTLCGLLLLLLLLLLLRRT